jgi:HTH-type transcriptional regulator / antitoxin HigA
MLNTIVGVGEKGAKGTLKEKVDAKKYGRLLTKVLPRVIETEEDNKKFLEILHELMRKGEKRTAEETSLAKLLARLIQDFEQRFYQMPTATPREVLRELMNANGLKQVDLVPVLGTKGVVSEILSGKRQISKAQAKALAKRFNISTDAFL